MAKKLSSIKKCLEGYDEPAALVAGFVNLLGVHRHGFQPRAVRQANEVQIIGDIIGDVIENDGLGTLLGKPPVLGSTGQILPLRIPDYHSYGIRTVHRVESIEKAVAEVNKNIADQLAMGTF